VQTGVTAKRQRNEPSGVAIVGPGRIGQSLGRLLAGAGVPVRFIAARRLLQARRAARFIGAGKPVSLDALELHQAAVILLAVSDSAVPGVAAHLARRGGSWKGRVVLHTCGSLDAGALQPLRQRGAAVGSLHPFQTVPNPTEGIRNLRGCFWAVEGDRAALKMARDWVKRLEGRTFRLRSGQRVLYHLAAFLSCAPSAVLMENSGQLLRRAGVPARTARSMLAGFVRETAGLWGKLGAQALTGPVVRADWSTVRRHLTALRQTSPRLLPLYRELVRAMLHLAGKSAPRGLLSSAGPRAGARPSAGSDARVGFNAGLTRTNPHHGKLNG
jgi:predicted short-subunit dehydrogenase-like oxidoreductase (DUF2520 family)